MLELQLRTQLDPVALLALLVSALSFSLSFLTWRRGRLNVIVDVSPDLISIPSDRFGSQMRISIRNVGGLKTTVESFAISAGRYDIGRSFIIPNPRPRSPPFVLEPGQKEDVYIYQDKLFEQTGRENVFVNVMILHKEKPLSKKVPKPKRTSK